MLKILQVHNLLLRGKKESKYKDQLTKDSNDND